MAAYQFGFIGTGNMGGALAAAVCAAVPPEQVLLANRSPEKARALADKLGCACAADNCAVARDCAYLFLGVKPQVMPAVLAQLAPVLAARSDRFVLVSMAAGLSTAQLAGLAGAAWPIVRIMPNTPAAIGKGVILYAANGAVAPGELEPLTAALAGAGALSALPESLMDAGSALSGCGPAFVYLFLEALADGGVACGLPRAAAQTYAAQTLIGAAELLLRSGQHPGALKDAVCSPGGSTIAGVRALEQAGFRAAVMDAVCAACARTKELGG